MLQFDGRCEPEKGGAHRGFADRPGIGVGYSLTTADSLEYRFRLAKSIRLCRLIYHSF